MFSALLWFSLASTVLGQSPATRPAQIILIRHAEEPRDEHNPHLSNSGVERADRLVSFISTDTLMTRFGQPDTVYDQGYVITYAGKKAKLEKFRFPTWTGRE